ncbi:hypothetical protein KEM56_000335, partial [Ascosphaera pollenicola]
MGQAARPPSASFVLSPAYVAQERSELVNGNRQLTSFPRPSTVAPTLPSHSSCSATTFDGGGLPVTSGYTVSIPHTRAPQALDYGTGLASAVSGDEVAGVPLTSTSFDAHTHLPPPAIATDWPLLDSFACDVNTNYSSMTTPAL